MKRKVPQRFGYESINKNRLIGDGLRKLQAGHIGLMLRHQPFCHRYDACRALEEAYKESKPCVIGISNFYSDHFIEIASNMGIVQAVKQAETHAFDQQIDPQKIMEESGAYIIKEYTYLNTYITMLLFSFGWSLLSFHAYVL